MRIPTRAALSTYAGPTPRPVVPIRRFPSLALPSSRHCVPTTTMLGMAFTPEYTLWMLEDFIHGPHTLRSIRKIHRDDLTRPGARVADDEHCPDALRLRVGDRLLEPAADDSASNRGPQVPGPAPQPAARRR